MEEIMQNYHVVIKLRTTNKIIKSIERNRCVWNFRSQYSDLSLEEM